MTISYGLGNQRVKTVQKRNNTIERVKYFAGDYELDSSATGVKKYHFIQGGHGLSAIFVKDDAGNDTMFYVFPDHLGSLTTLVNASSHEVLRYSYNAWGQARDANDWSARASTRPFAGRGYTGHEHLSAFSLINMNGRVYDPVLGRFLSPDPFVQSPEYPNNYNRYVYALNNPFRFVDPSGYFNAKPAPYEREQAQGAHTYYNWEAMWKLGNIRRTPPNFSASMAGHPTGGWTYAGGGLYVNIFSGDKMESSDFLQNTPYLTSSAYVDYSPAAVANAVMGSKEMELLDGTDPLGSRMAIFTYTSGKVSGGPVPFWEITGSYYNELYYYSGLVAFDTYAAKAPNGGIPHGGIMFYNESGELQYASGLGKENVIYTVSDGDVAEFSRSLRDINPPVNPAGVFEMQLLADVYGDTKYKVGILDSGDIILGLPVRPKSSYILMILSFAGEGFASGYAGGHVQMNNTLGWQGLQNHYEMQSGVKEYWINYYDAAFFQPWW